MTNRLNAGRHALIAAVPTLQAKVYRGNAGIVRDGLERSIEDKLE